MASHSEEKNDIARMARGWLSGELQQIDLDGLTDRELLVLWWDLVVFLHDRFGYKLRFLEEEMGARNVEIPKGKDELLKKARLFLWEQ